MITDPPRSTLTDKLVPYTTLRRSHAAAARRPHHRRDRARLPGAGTDHRAAHRTRQAHAGRGQRALRGAERRGARRAAVGGAVGRSDEHTSELQSLMRLSYAGFSWQNKP